ncbi:MAG: thiamine-phosphate kinase [Bacilli bacterium]|nr:thiamine-phosphate kinase [Bacilli bacterium]
MPEMDEFALIRRLTQPHQSDALQKILGVVVGIGDDAAVVEVTPGAQMVVSCDTMVQDIHFNQKTMCMTDVGFKAMAAAVSDLAAMGAIPRYALISLTVPRDSDFGSLQELYDGLYECAGKYGVALIGGDTTSSKLGGWVVSVTVTGEIEAGKSLLRSSAKPGDAVFVTGALGSSAAGLDFLLSVLPLEDMLNATESSRQAIEHFMEVHRRPLPQVRAGRTLLECGGCHALNDISDGLASEAWEIAEASECGLLLYEEQIPLAPDLRWYAESRGKAVMDWVLYGGEDYQLVGTISQSQVDLVQKAFKRRQLSLHIIGEVRSDLAGVFLRNDKGLTEEVPKQGYNHFA